uniref:Tumor protein p53-inducible nuclear protein 1 n=1 Tax=Neogobius melanostomus TaxID=47308 RepID=A0A8C6T569_9GOBI
MLPSPTAPPMVRCPSLTSLNSTTTEPDDATATGPEQDPGSDQDSDQDCEDFLRLDPGCMEESWFVTPPACFTRAQPLPLEPSPLENLLIEHPSMSVYLLPLRANDGRPHPQHGNRPRPPPHLSSKPRPPHLQRAPGNGNKPGSGKKAKRGGMDSKHRPEGIQRRPASSCLSASLTAHVSASGRLDALQPRPPHSLSKNAMRRLNPQRPLKTAALQLHQPSQRQLNF